MHSQSSASRCSSPLKKVSEAEIIQGCRRVEIRSRILKYRILVKNGLMRREVIAGMPYYIPVGEASP
jgi:hypothetical protein